MRYLIVFAHPRGDSFSAALRHVVVDTLARAGHQIDLVDLNDSHFDPALSAASRGSYFDVGHNLAGVEEHVARLRGASPSARITKLVDDWLLAPRILHPWPDQRFAAKHPRYEPDSRIGPVRIWAGACLAMGIPTATQDP